jgi:hypothetical protein
MHQHCLRKAAQILLAFIDRNQIETMGLTKSVEANLFRQKRQEAWFQYLVMLNKETSLTFTSKFSFCSGHVALHTSQIAEGSRFFAVSVRVMRHTYASLIDKTYSRTSH